MSESLLEYAAINSPAWQLDRAAAVVRGVKILGLKSANGRDYKPAALQAALPLYEGAKVNVNHPKSVAAGPRDYQDRFGTLTNVRFDEGQGLFGELHYNPKHPLAEQFLWDAEHAPHNVGLSHHVIARTSRQGETLIVEEILQVQSVDLVADPATTRGLFENATETECATGVPPVGLAEAQEAARNVQIAELARLRMELAESHAANQTLAEAAAKRVRITTLLHEAGLPDPQANDPVARFVLDEQFLQAVTMAPNDASARRLVTQRVQLLEAVERWNRDRRTARLPRSRDQSAVDAPPQSLLSVPRAEQLRTFAAALRGSSLAVGR